MPEGAVRAQEHRLETLGCSEEAADDGFRNRAGQDLRLRSRR